MKKIFRQFGGRILKYRKRLVYWALAVSVGQICFFGINLIWIENQAFAAEEEQQTQTMEEAFQKKAIERNNTLTFLKRVVYVWLYPILYLTWRLVDNSFVYGEVFGFDAVLWKLWNLTKNLANFALWFLVVYKIFEYLLKWDKKTDVKKLLISALIAWVWIQASWFLMAALIDVSTILAYGVGSLPLSILWEDNSSTTEGGKDTSLAYNPYVLKTVVYVNVSDVDTTSIYLTNYKTGWGGNEFYISECETVLYESQELLLAPKMIYYADEGGAVHNTVNNKCHVYGQVYIFNGLYEKIEWPTCENLKWCQDAQSKYTSNLSTIKTELKGNSGLVYGLVADKRQLLQIWDAHITGGVIWMMWGLLPEDFWLDRYNKRTWGGNGNIRLSDLLEWKSYVGVFTTLYSSLTNSVWVIPSDVWIFSSLLSAILSLWHMLAIAVPLLAAAVLFMMRIWILRVAIAISPFIVLVKAFNLEKTIEKHDKNKLLEYFTVENLIGIIFSPAIVCFAVSISTVVVRMISDMNNEPIATETETFLWWILQLNVWSLTIPIAKFIVAVSGIAITWFLVWVAVKSSKLWESTIITSLEKLWRTAIWSAPIIPIPTKDWGTTFIWADSAFGLNGRPWFFQTFQNSVDQNSYKRDDAAMNALLNDESGSENQWKHNSSQTSPVGGGNRVAAYVTGLGALSSVENWQDKEIEIKDGETTKFSTMTLPEKKEVINAINEREDADKKKSLWGTAGEIVFDDGEGTNIKYKYDENKKRYEIQQTQ